MSEPNWIRIKEYQIENFSAYRRLYLNEEMRSEACSSTTTAHKLRPTGKFSLLGVPVAFRGVVTIVEGLLYDDAVALLDRVEDAEGVPFWNEADAAKRRDSALPDVKNLNPVSDKCTVGGPSGAQPDAPNLDTGFISQP